MSFLLFSVSYKELKESLVFRHIFFNGVIAAKE